MTKLPLFPDRKVKVGVYSITGCAGCQLSIIFNEDELLSLIDLIDLKAFPFIKEQNVEEGGFDFVFMEGLVAGNEDLEVLQKVRENTTYLVALGACAATGCVPAYRNFTLKENYEHLLYRKMEDLQDLQRRFIAILTPFRYQLGVNIVSTRPSFLVKMGLRKEIMANKKQTPTIDKIRIN